MKGLKWIAIGVKITPLIIAAVHGVERLVKGASGQDKQDAAVDLVGEMLQAIEGATSQDLLDEAEVQAALRDAINAIVHVQNVIAAVQKARTN